MNNRDDVAPQNPDAPGTSQDTGAATAVLERPEASEERLRDDTGDADRFSHYVSKEKMLESRMTGRPVVALCGKVWVPKRDPKDYPICPDCQRIYEQLYQQ